MITPIFDTLFRKNNVNFGNSKVNVVYMNDMHGSLSFIDSFVTARDEFYRENKEGTNWTLSGGDMFMKGSENNKVVAHFVDEYVDAVGIGNHDVANANQFSDLLKKYNISHKFLSANLAVDNKHELSKQITKSVIISDGDENIGVIGVSPFDFNKTVSRNSDNNFVSVKGLKETVNAVKAEVDKLEKEGVNKIFLLAHTGEFSNDKKGIDYYKAFAKIGGIDVIIGGHDHMLVDRWENSDRPCEGASGYKEPVLIVSTGSGKGLFFSENLNMFGTLNLEFDDNGVLVPEDCIQTLRYTHDYPKTNFISKYLDSDAQTVIGEIPVPIVTTSNPLRNENEVANFVADSDFWYVKNHSASDEQPDFAFINPGTIRDAFPHTEVTKINIRQVLPFKESIVKADLTKKQIYEALRISAESTTYNKATPGLMQVSHMTYKVNPDYSISDVKILDDEGNVRFNLDEMDDDDTFTCVYDSFLASGPNLLGCLKAEEFEDYQVTRAQALTEYLQSGADIPDHSTGRIRLREDK